MSTNYPSGTDSLTNPAGTSLLTSPDHAGQHTNINDAMEAVQTTAGTTAGTNVLKHFAAGEFPVRHTGVAATGTLQQTLVGGTLNKNEFGSSRMTGGTVNNAVVGTPAITGGTSNAMQVIGTDILSLAGLFGTSSITSSENNTLGTFGNTTYANGTNVGSIVFTPQVAIRPLIFLQILWRNNTVNVTNSVDLSINGTSEGVGSGVDFINSAYGTTFTTPAFGIHLADSTLGAGTAGTIIARIKVSAGSAIVARSEMIVLPFPAT